MTETNRQPGQIIRPGWPNYTHFGTAENPFDDLLVVDTAIKQVKSYADTSDEALPWCMYVGTLGPHDPYTPPSKYLDWYDLSDIELPQSFDDTMDDKPGLYRRTRDRFDQLTAEEHRDAIRHYLAFCSYEDALFGKLVSALEETDQLDNTVVVFLSDHGDYLGEHGLWGKGLPAFQSAYRIPLVIGGPGISPDLQGAQLDHPTSIVDVGPTIVELCDVEPSYQVSGTSLVLLLTNSSQETPKPDVFFQSNGNEAFGIQRAVISDGWKLVYNMFDQDELYDLGKDPEEITNLLADPVGQRKVGRGPLDSIPSNLRAKVEELYRKLWKFGIAHDDENINGYVLTALAPFGPGIVADPSSSKNYLGNDEANSLNTQQLSGSTPV
ncbi:MULTISPECIES: sulfatase-like hydrolase/transferase [unclassified Ruegeria]|uniref:sulfatase-like hydrolase/transferase n=1 Tax=unclassified Ruegeria TaxID=2625375 RepID=UPI0014887DBC|nr:MULTISPECIES: sulfatase-like hydrolase/transferase [unclassified Ruegeria]